MGSKDAQKNQQCGVYRDSDGDCKPNLPTKPGEAYGQSKQHGIGKHAACGFCLFWADVDKFETQYGDCGGGKNTLKLTGALVMEPPALDTTK